MVIMDSVYDCYGFNLELDDGSIDTHVYVLKSYNKKEAETDIRKRFAPNKVTRVHKIQDPLEDITEMQRTTKEYYDDLSGQIRNTKDLSSKRKRRIAE
jgi:N-glycosylase/DNA lyase